MHRKTLSIILLALFATADAAAQVRVIKAARMVDVNTGQVTSPAIVVVDQGVITAVGASATFPVGAMVIDLGDKTLLPGLIDAHTHMLLNLPANSIVASDLDMAIMTEDTATRALRGVKFAREMLEAGFTAIRDLGNAGANGDVALRDAINAGYTVGPRMQVSTRIISPVGGQHIRLPKEMQGLINIDYRQVNGADEARKAVRQALYEGADIIKVCVSDTGSPISLSPDEMKAIVGEAHRLKLKVAAHAAFEEEASIAIEAGVDSLEHGWRISHQLLDQMAAKGIWLVPTDNTKEAVLGLGCTDKSKITRAEAGERRKNERLAYAIKAGVRVAAGSDATSSLLGLNRGQSSKDMFHSYARAGVSSIKIIQMTTIRAAELMGWEGQVGSLEKGKFADIIAVDGDPTKDISLLDHVSFVMKAGLVIKAASE
jgi:imidazolonepropionase-like amidohydrolase